MARIKADLPGGRECRTIKHNCFAFPQVSGRALPVGCRVCDSNKNGGRPRFRGLDDPCRQGALAVLNSAAAIIHPPDAVIGAAGTIQAEIDEILHREGPLITKLHEASNARKSRQAGVAGPSRLPIGSLCQVEMEELWLQIMVRMKEDSIILSSGCRVCQPGSRLNCELRVWRDLNISNHVSV